MIMKIMPNFNCGINVEEVINYVLVYRIENPKNYHAIATNPSAKKKIILSGMRNGAINEVNLVICCQSHKYGMTPSIVVRSNQLMRDKDETWMISILKKIRIGESSIDIEVEVLTIKQFVLLPPHHLNEMKMKGKKNTEGIAKKML